MKTFPLRPRLHLCLLVPVWLLAASARGQTPQITEQPRGWIVSPGSTATFSVVATGQAPLGYRWRRNGVTLAGQTNATLDVPNVTTNGVYTVVVNNTLGSRVSLNAHLGLLTIRRGADGVGLDLTGTAGRSYELQFVTEASATNWQALTNLTLPASFYRLALDPSPAGEEVRFFRAAQVGAP